MNKILVFKDVNYGASKTSSTKNTALTPDQLANGALGIYGIDPTLSAQQLSLIVDASSTTNQVAFGSYKGTKLYFYQGTSTGCILASAITIPAIRSIRSKIYTAAVLGVTNVGYSTLSSENLNFPSVISRGDEMILKVTDLNLAISATTLGRSYSGYATIDDATEYQILVDLITRVYETDNTTNDRLIDLKVSGNIAGSVIGNSATAAVTYGSATITTSDAHLVGVADWVKLNGDVYQAITGTTGSTLVLDRPYRGATNAALANAVCLDLGATAPTSHGLVITDKNINTNLSFALDGIAVSSTTTVVTSPVQSTGYGTQIYELELQARPHRGRLDNIDRRLPLPETFAVTTSGYNIYTIEAGNYLSNSDMQGFGKTGDQELVLAFLTGIADTSGKNESDFCDIIPTFYPSVVTIL